jgi:hypothetical protein
MISPRHASLRQLLDYWLRLKGDRSRPRKREFDPVDLPPRVLPRLFLIEFLEGAGNYRLRLMGTYLRDTYGREFTWCHLVDEEMPGVTKSDTYQLLGVMARTGEPQYSLGPTRFRFFDTYSLVEQVLLPLADDEGQLGFAIGAVDYPDMRKGIGASYLPLLTQLLGT